MATSGPFTVYAPPGVYTRTLFSPNVAGITGSVRIPVFIGTGQETILVEDLEVIRGSSAIADNPIIGEDVSQQLDGTNSIFTVANYPIVRGDGSGTVTFNPRDVTVTINGDPVAVAQVLGDIGRVSLNIIPRDEDIVLIDYFFKRTDTKITDEDHSIEVDGSNKTFKVFHRPIVTGDGGGVTTNSIADVTVKVNGSIVSVKSVSGQSGFVTLNSAPAAGSTVTVTYFFNKFQDTFDYLAHNRITSVNHVGNGPGRQDYIEDVDFTVVDNAIIWGAAVKVRTGGGVHTPDTEFFDSTQIFTTLVDVRYYLVPATGVKNASNKVFTLVATPTDGSGRDTPSEDTTLIKAYVGKNADEAYLNGEVGVTRISSSLRQITLKDAPRGAEQATLTSVPVQASLTSTNAPNSNPTFALLVGNALGPFTIVAGTNDTFNITFDNQVGAGAPVTVTVPLTSGTTAQMATLINSYVNNAFPTVAAPDTACTLALLPAAPGPVDAGAHYYKYTFVTAIGETTPSPASLVITTDAGNGNVTVTVPVGPAGVTSRNVYRTVADDPNTGDYKKVGAIPDNATPTLADDTLNDAGLGALAPTLNSTSTWACASNFSNRVRLTAFNSTGNTTGNGPGLAGVNSAITVGGNAATTLGFLTGNNTATGTSASANPKTWTITSPVNDVLQVMISVASGTTMLSNTYTINFPAGEQSAATVAAIINAVIISQGTCTATGDAFTIKVNGASGDRKLEIPAGGAATSFGLVAPNDASRGAGAEPFFLENGVNDTVVLTFDGGSPRTVSFAPSDGIGGVGSYTAKQVVDAINLITCPTLGACDGLAEVANISSVIKGIKISSSTFGDTSSIQVSGNAEVTLGFGTPNNADIGSNEQNVYVTFYSNLLTDDVYNFMVEVDGPAGVGEYSIKENNFADDIANPALDLVNSRVGDPNFALEQVIFPFDFPDIQTIPHYAVDETVTITFVGTSPAKQYTVASTNADGSFGTGELNRTYIDVRTGLRFTIFDPNQLTPELPDGRDTGAAITNPYSFSGDPTPARLVGNLPETFDIILATNDTVTFTFENAQGSFTPPTVTTSVLLTPPGLNKTATQIVNIINAAIDAAYPTNAPNNFARVVANRIVLKNFDATGDPTGPGGPGLSSLLTVGGNAAETLGFGAGNNFDAGSSTDYLKINIVKPGVFKTGNTPNIQVPGLWTTVNNTFNIGVGDTGLVQTFDKTGREPAVGDFYYITYEYQKIDFGVKLFTRFQDIENEYGKLSPFNKLTLAAYMAFLNGAAVVAMKQVLKDPDGVDATDQSYIDALKELEKPLPGSLLPDLIVPLTTSINVQEVLRDHVIKMSSERYQSERMAIAGYPQGTLPFEAQEIAKNFKAKEFIYIYPDFGIIGLNNEIGELEEFVADGALLAAAYAGRDCSPVFDVATPLTRKQIVGFRRLGRRLDAVEMNQTAIAGITILQDQEPVIIIRHALTTDFTNVLTRESNVIKTTHFVQRIMRANLDQYIGQKFLLGAEADIEATTRAVMRALKDSEIITDFTGIRATVDETDPTQANVEVFYRPVFAINYIRVTFNLRTTL